MYQNLSKIIIGIVILISGIYDQRKLSLKKKDVKEKKYLKWKNIYGF